MVILEAVSDVLSALWDIGFPQALCLLSANSNHTM